MVANMNDEVKSNVTKLWVGKINRPSDSKERNLCAAFFHWEILGYLARSEKILSDTQANSEAKFLKK